MQEGWSGWSYAVNPYDGALFVLLQATAYKVNQSRYTTHSKVHCGFCRLVSRNRTLLDLSWLVVLLIAQDLIRDGRAVQSGPVRLETGQSRDVLQAEGNSLLARALQIAIHLHATMSQRLPDLLAGYVVSTSLERLTGRAATPHRFEVLIGPIRPSALSRQQQPAKLVVPPEGSMTFW